MPPRRCPFYGFRWPERTAHLIEAGGNECGLDLDIHGSCTMESAGAAPDFDRCQTAATLQWFLFLASRRLRFFPSGSTAGLAWKDWNHHVMQSGK